MKARRSSPSTATSNTVLVAGVGLLPPVGWGPLRGTLDLSELVLIALVAGPAALVTYMLSAEAHRGRD